MSHRPHSLQSSFAGRLLPGFKALAFLWVAESGVAEVIEKSSLKTQVNFLTIAREVIERAS